MLSLAFALGAFALILQGVLHPYLPILAFAPAIAFASLRSSFPKTLWFSALAGALVDLLSEDPMGVHALNYTMAAALLYRFRNPFSHDEALHLSLYTALLSALSTILQLFLLFLFDRRIPFNGKWVLADLIGMPLFDALYAFVWFTAPLALVERLRRHWMVFWLKRKKASPTSR